MKSFKESINPFPLNDKGELPTYFQSQISGLMDDTITKFDLLPVTIVGIKLYVFKTPKFYILKKPFLN